MKIFSSKIDLQEYLKEFRTSDKTIGFVPTMGALHPGHLSLVNESKKQNSVTVVSIYVNPTQFNDKNDLKNYPRNLEKDCEMLEKVNCDCVFTPTDAEMYPEHDNRVFEFGLLDKVMEGKYRSGHFNGVAQIVSKLFDSVHPNSAYFGEKDFQQLSIVREMSKQLNLPIAIVGCPIVREPDGLAMSSRNQLLTYEIRQEASMIYKSLVNAKKLIPDSNLNSIKLFIENTFASHPFLKLEYFEIVNSETLQSIENLMINQPIRACIAVFAGNIRLIDNIEFNS